MSEKKQSKTQVQADVSTFICAICFAFLVKMLLDPPMGGAGLGVIFPLIFVVILHLSLGLSALIAAISTGRFYRNLWIYLYFTGVVLATLSYFDVHQAIRNSVQSTFEKQAHPNETNLYEAIIARDSHGVGVALVEEPDLEYCFKHVSDFEKFSPMQYAVEYADRSIVVQLLKSGADPNYYCEVPDDGRRPMLTAAVRRGDGQLVQALLNAGADPNPGMADTPLGAAVAKNSSLPDGAYISTIRSNMDIERIRSSVRMLLDAGADPNVDHYGARPIHWAVVYADMSLFNSLVASGAALDSPDKRGRGLVELAVVYNAPEIVEFLLTETSPNLSGRPGLNLLRHAGFHKNQLLIDRLLASGLDVSLLYDESYRASIDDPNTHLVDLGDEYFEAVKSGNKIYADALIRAGVDINHPDRSGRLIISRFAQDAEILKSLIASGADVNAVGYGGNTALHHIASCKRCTNPLVAMQNLLDNGAELNAANAQGQTPLGLANQARLQDVKDFLWGKNALPSLEVDE